jgi:hypothetical protein
MESFTDNNIRGLRGDRGLVGEAAMVRVLSLSVA